MRCDLKTKSRCQLQPVNLDAAIILRGFLSAVLERLRITCQRQLDHIMPIPVDSKRRGHSTPVKSLDQFYCDEQSNVDSYETEITSRSFLSGP